MGSSEKKKPPRRQGRVLAEVRQHKGLAAAYFILRLLVIITMVAQFLHGNYYNVLICVLTLVLMLIPSFVERQIRVDVPDTLEVIILLFIFSAEILGEIQEYYVLIPGWDTMLHTINGFIMAGIGFSMIDLLNQNKRFSIQMSPLFVALVSFCFSMTIGVLWEFFEYGADTFFHTDMQKDTFIQAVTSVSLHPDGRNIAVTVPIESVVINGETWPGYLDIGLHDTMKDLLVNFIGAVIYSIIGVFYIRGRSKGKFARRFILTPKDPPQGQEDDSNAGKDPKNSGGATKG